jgi:hypothetical protein
MAPPAVAQVDMARPVLPDQRIGQYDWNKYTEFDIFTGTDYQRAAPRRSPAVVDLASYYRLKGAIDGHRANRNARPRKSRWAVYRSPPAGAAGRG